jgi:hypothetical protein
MARLATRNVPPLRRADEVSRRTSRGSFVVIQQAAKPRTPTNPALASLGRLALNEPIVEPLMISLMMVMGDEFHDGPSEVPLANRNHPIEALLFDRSHEPFGVGIGIGGSAWRLHHADPRSLSR